MPGPTGTTENKGASTSSPAPSSSPSSSPAPSSSAPSGGKSASTASPIATSAAKAGSALASLEKVTASLETPTSPADASSASATAATAAGSPGATQGATDPAATAGQPQSPNEAPEPRIVAATRNAREQARAEVEKEIGWVRELGNREAVEESVSLIRYARSSRASALEFYNQLGSELGLPPYDGTGSNGHTSTAGTSSAPKPFALPKGKLVAEDGTDAFSVAQVGEILKDFRADVMREVQALSKPALDFAAEGRTAQEHTEMKMAAATDAKSVLTAARELPHFTQNEKLISEELSKIPKSLRMKVGSVAALYMAYNKVLTERVLPMLRQQGSEEEIADLKRSAAAGASAVGTTTATASTKPILRDGNVTDLAAHMRKIAGSAVATQ